MQNPADILGIDPSGAQHKPFDGRDYPLHSPEIGGAIMPFDWNAGFDVEKALGYTVPTKDQGQSSSCGGQTISQQAQALAIANFQKNFEGSAKAYYSQAFVPGGGSNARVLGEIAKSQGLYRESLVPSYNNGDSPSEAFMERPQDITAEARADAALEVGMVAYAWPLVNMDAMAAALRDHKNLLIGIYGSNNGTWLTSHPSATKVGDYWAHFMFGAKANIDRGRPTIWAKQSWGPSVAPDTNAYQAITGDHFAAGQIWEAMVLTFAPKPTPTGHVFNVNILYGQQSSEVTELQKTLARDGLFNLAPTGYYGDVTARAVVKFRAKHGVDGSTDPLGHTVGPRTRAALNQIT